MCSETGTLCAISALARRRLFSTGTAPSSAVCHKKQGGVFSVTLNSAVRARIWRRSNFSPIRLYAEPSCQY